MDLLARRPHFRRELAVKLGHRGWDDEDVVRVLDRLEAQKLLDDRALAHAWISRRLERGDAGRRFLAADLERRGAPPEIVREVLDELVPDDDGELAGGAAERWRRLHPAGQPAALARHLERRGFTQRAILAAVRELESDLGSDSEPA